MENKRDSSKFSLIERLRSGEIISCDKCKKGHYVTSATDIKASNFFYCTSCGNYVHVSLDVTVD